MVGGSREEMNATARKSLNKFIHRSCQNVTIMLKLYVQISSLFSVYMHYVCDSGKTISESLA